LLVLHDAASLFSGWTDSTGNSSKMSRRFLFDAQLMGPKVYQRAVRSLFRLTVRAKVGGVKVLLLGEPDSGKDTLIKEIEANNPLTNTSEELKSYR
jgi:transcriptional regulator of acetoin/glycerol metabolism